MHERRTLKHLYKINQQFGPNILVLIEFNFGYTYIRRYRRNKAKNIAIQMHYNSRVINLDGCKRTGHDSTENKHSRG